MTPRYVDVMGRRIRFFEACGEGVMCPIGRGRIDYPAVRTLLTDIDYGGYITIEQERDPRNTGSILADLAASRDFLRESGSSRRGIGRMKTLDLITIGRSSVDLYGDQIGGRVGGHGLVLEVHRGLANEHRLRHCAAGASNPRSSPGSVTSTWAGSSSSSSPARAWTHVG